LEKWTISSKFNSPAIKYFNHKPDVVCIDCDCEINHFRGTQFFDDFMGQPNMFKWQQILNHM